MLPNKSIATFTTGILYSAIIMLWIQADVLQALPAQRVLQHISTVHQRRAFKSHAYEELPKLAPAQDASSGSSRRTSRLLRLISCGQLPQDSSRSTLLTDEKKTPSSRSFPGADGRIFIGGYRPRTSYHEVDSDLKYSSTPSSTKRICSSMGRKFQSLNSLREPQGARTALFHEARFSDDPIPSVQNPNQDIASPTRISSRPNPTESAKEPISPMEISFPILQESIPNVPAWWQSKTGREKQS
ncbi:hypothetical protein PCASD_24371 [Puccinia coronata f. sp. avenae]|uniref:Uncharacterized protein n=1 Tax=Puccinia coronata f. sp. avenae TaxID=200324 RepID=A0A2N5SGW9_9BASI|nr:hypothetical protein PCASD_24371 [Puccinia coronata f. sp. avenae]